MSADNRPDAQSNTFPTCRCPECKCTTMLEESAWEKPRSEQLCEECTAGEHSEDLR